jgi:hypothetical protein
VKATTIADVVGLGDQALADKALLLTDGLGLSDAILRHKRFALLDAVALSEVVGTPVRLLVSVDLVSLVESVTLRKPKVVLRQGALSLPLEYVTSLPLTIPALLVEHDVPGVLGGELQSLGFGTHQLSVRGFFQGPDAKSDLNILEEMEAAGTPVTVTVLGASGELFSSGVYYMVSLERGIPAGRPAPLVRVGYEIRFRGKAT